MKITGKLPPNIGFSNPEYRFLSFMACDFKITATDTCISHHNLPQDYTIYVPDINAAAILEDGTPILIIDVDDMMRSIDNFLNNKRLKHVGGRGISDKKKSRKRILVCDCRYGCCGIVPVSFDRMWRVLRHPRCVQT